MPAKYWLLPLFALAMLVFAAHGPARADQEQFVVTYVEFLPAKHGNLLLIPFGSLAPLQLPGRGLKVALHSVVPWRCDFGQPGAFQKPSVMRHV